MTYSRVKSYSNSSREYTKKHAGRAKTVWRAPPYYCPSASYPLCYTGGKDGELYDIEDALYWL